MYDIYVCIYKRKIKIFVLQLTWIPFFNWVKNPFKSPPPRGHRSQEYMVFPLKIPRLPAFGALR